MLFQILQTVRQCGIMLIGFIDALNGVNIFFIATVAISGRSERNATDNYNLPWKYRLRLNFWINCTLLFIFASIIALTLATRCLDAMAIKMREIKCCLQLSGSVEHISHLRRNNEKHFWDKWRRRLRVPLRSDKVVGNIGLKELLRACYAWKLIHNSAYEGFVIYHSPVHRSKCASMYGKKPNSLFSVDFQETITILCFWPLLFQNYKPWTYSQTYF